MTRSDTELLEARVAARMAALLGEAAHPLPPGVEERLRIARDRALAHARQQRVAGGAAAAPARRPAQPGGLAGLLAWPRLGPALGAALPALVLSLGAWLITDHGVREDAAVAASVDLALLTDDLPPQAYADPGFTAFLKLQQP